MIIRNFVAETAEDAYQMARRTLGADAIILSTKQKRQGNWITKWFRAPAVEVVAGRPKSRPETGTFRSPSTRPPSSSPSHPSLEARPRPANTPPPRPAHHLSSPPGIRPSGMPLAPVSSGDFPPPPPGGPLPGRASLASAPPPRGRATRPSLAPPPALGAPPEPQPNRIPEVPVALAPQPPPVHPLSSHPPRPEAPALPPPQPIVLHDSYPEPRLPPPQAAPEIQAQGSRGSPTPAPPEFVPVGPSASLPAPAPSSLPTSREAEARALPEVPPVPPPRPPEPHPLEEKMEALQKQVAELADLKTLIESVVKRSPEVQPVPLPVKAKMAIEALPEPTRSTRAVEGLMAGLRATRLDHRLVEAVRKGLEARGQDLDLDDPGVVYEAALDLLGTSIPTGQGLDTLGAKGKPEVMVLVGPTGVGKTTTLAKLAAGLQFHHQKKVAFITLDTFRIAAPEQLKQYAEIIDIPIQVVFQPEELKSQIQSFQDRDVILVDTVGRSHRNREDIDELARFLSVLPEAKVHLVLAANTKYEDMKDAVAVFRKLGVGGLLMTKLDETASYGELVNLSTREDLPLQFLTTGQSVPDDIQAAKSREVARLVMPTPPRDEANEVEAEDELDRGEED